jgi:hypothetical protein
LTVLTELSARTRNLLVAAIVALLGVGAVSALLVDGGTDDGDRVDLGAPTTSSTATTPGADVTTAPSTSSSTSVPSTTVTTPPGGTTPGGTGTTGTGTQGTGSGLGTGGTGTVASGTNGVPETGGDDLLLPGLALLAGGGAFRRLRRR